MKIPWWWFLLFVVMTSVAAFYQTVAPGATRAQSPFSSTTRLLVAQPLTPRTNDVRRRKEKLEPPPIPVLSVYNILHPASFNTPGEGMNISKSLFTILRLFRKALSKLEQLDMPQEILRIQHTVATLDDPLQWLSKQKKELPHVVYLNIPDQLDVAAVGATIQTTTKELWDCDLPQQARWYGGARFDEQRSIEAEWDEFGNSYWILPTFELMRNFQTNTTTFSMQLVKNQVGNRWNIEHALNLLEQLNSDLSHKRPPTTLPPILSRTTDGQENYEAAVTAALHAIETTNSLQKVVLARKSSLQFATTVSGLDIVRKWKYGGHEGGSIFYIKPKTNEFFGCTPETLFTVTNSQVLSEALAGTRPRGTNQQDDQKLLNELVDSPKDQLENRLTGQYIEDAFARLSNLNYIELNQPDDGGYFVRRLLHLQHICKQYSARLTTEAMVVAKELLGKLHPTPAVAGLPMQDANSFIRRHESFDRGFYSGPVGYIGRDGSSLVVAIRSGLTTRSGDTTTVSAFAGSGLVKGSTLHGEWAETNYKFAVISSLFPQSPVTLRGSPTPNVAWASAFVTELVRNGVTTFYVCPGSRSTPLVVALAKAVRAHPGVLHAISVHDERAAGFRAVGYARGGQPAAVITSSGTAVANLYPAIVEASMDGLPMLLLTADRPYESRNTGANQAIDQVKMFSDTYIRWFRDILPPSDDVPVSVALSDACHAVTLTREQRGPVHVNMQFRENLAPDSGPIRNDARVGSVTKFDGRRFTDVPGFDRWSNHGCKWYTTYCDSMQQSSAVADVARLILSLKRGIIVVGNVRPPSGESENGDQSVVLQCIADFAQTIGFPIFASAQSSRLRFSSAAVVPFAEHVLKTPIVAENFDPDLVIQVGSPLVSTALLSAFKKRTPSAYVLIHPHYSQERADPEFLVTHRISSEISPFLNCVVTALSAMGRDDTCSSDLAPLILLGRMLQKSMKSIIQEASKAVVEEVKSKHALTEPQIILALSETTSQGNERSFFLSNSMAVRDTEMFFYPYGTKPNRFDGIKAVGTNRGASGIDGIISSSLGLRDSSDTPTTLLIGDLAALHDVGSLYSVVEREVHGTSSQKKNHHPLTTIIVNNNGSGIFSFLPIAKHGEDVMFEDFFGTPTSSFSFQKGAQAFSLPVDMADNYESFYSKYQKALLDEDDSVLEARVTNRQVNVAVHNKISESVEYFIDRVLKRSSPFSHRRSLPVKIYAFADDSLQRKEKTLVLLHGWMGDRFEWNTVATTLTKTIGRDWRIISVDLPGHGGDPLRLSSPQNSARSALFPLDDSDSTDYSVTGMAESVLYSLREHHGITRIDALAGYSAGGRIALAMKRLCLLSGGVSLIVPDTAMILLGANPGVSSGEADDLRNVDRIQKDDDLSEEIVNRCNRDCLSASTEDSMTQMDELLARWYRNSIWGKLQGSKLYSTMIRKRSRQLSKRGRDIAAFLSYASPPRNGKDDWRHCSKDNTLFVAGSQDPKYTKIGESLSEKEIARYRCINDCGHALLVEKPDQVAEVIADFLTSELTGKTLDFSTQRDSNAELGKDQPPVGANELESSQSAVAEKDRLWSKTVNVLDSIDSLQFSTFSTSLAGENGIEPLSGIGWGDNAFSGRSSTLSREGLIIQLKCTNGLEVGLGEISPLRGMHMETLDDAQKVIETLQDKLRTSEPEALPCFAAEQILTLDGSLGDLIASLAAWSGLDSFSPSVHSGLEMALLSLAAQKTSLPIHQALASSSKLKSAKLSGTLPLNGLITRNASVGRTSTVRSRRSFPSLKVKVGQPSMADDVSAMLRCFQLAEMYHGQSDCVLRADANRSWNESQAVEFALALEGLDLHASEKIEYVEEPLRKLSGDSWTLEAQVEALERNYLHTAVPYALDESIFDLMELHKWEMTMVEDTLREIFRKGPRGCAALVLKPAILGLERSMRIARLARQELGVAAVFSSSFDSGVGLAHTAFLAYLSDQIPSTAKTYPHGVGTFTMLGADTLTPPFGSYVNAEGSLNIASLSRALYGLSLDELQESSPAEPLPVPPPRQVRGVSSSKETYEASTATSGSGTEISVVASLPLPFPAETANSRFTDLPSMSRWSPWISSVQYFGSQTEWCIDVRGIPLKWRAESQLLDDPFPGIQWQSVSGISNRGIVEFVPDESNPNSCTMNVRMTIVTPKMLRPLFQGTSVFVEEFLRDKLLKWSLQMFRDAVKADLALERGDVELGDALIGAVEGKATAIEATLSIGKPLRDDESDSFA